MAVISIANAKGGAGKTTASVLLATEFVARDLTTAYLDCDHLKFGSRWLNKAIASNSLEVTDHVLVSNLANHLRGMRNKFHNIIIDLSGASDQLIALAAGLSDIIIVPVQGSAMDGQGAVHVFEIIDFVSQNTNTAVRKAVVLSRTNPLVTTRSLRDVSTMLSARHITMLQTPIYERSAYRDMFGLERNLYALADKSVSNLAKAKDNMRAFTNDVVDIVCPQQADLSSPPYAGICFREDVANTARRRPVMRGALAARG